MNRLTLFNHNLYHFQFPGLGKSQAKTMANDNESLASVEQKGVLEPPQQEHPSSGTIIQCIDISILEHFTGKTFSVKK